MRKLTYIFLLFCGLAFGQVPSFPGAVGFGNQTTGGKGGTVLFVTNLNDSGSGSFRAAAEASGARTIVFRVGGTISLSNHIYIDNGNVTIAGQTAPGGGILIKDRSVIVRSSNVIVRYMRFRLGLGAGSDDDAFSITAKSGENLTNVMVDHCSFSWGRDENFNIRADAGNNTVRNVTLQNSIMSECGKNMLIHYNVGDFTIYQNLYALNYERNPRANYGYEGVFKFELINNLIYAWNGDATNPSNGQKYTVLNNKYKISSSFTPSNTTVIGSNEADVGVPDSWTYAYVAGNIIPSGYTLLKPRTEPYLETTPFKSSTLTANAYPASQVEDSILSHVGASLPLRDAVDTRIINSYNAGTGTIAYTGTYPTISSGTAYTDSDSDGMDDSWETTNFGDLTKGNNGFDLSADYTNLQMFLSYLAGDESTPPPAPTCSDGIQNGDETGIDCGGSCSPCSSPETSTGAGARAFMNYLLTN